ncbi:MAG: DUF4914 family protein [Spirochaetia bacterium]
MKKEKTTKYEFLLEEEIAKALSSPQIIVPKSRFEMLDMAFGGAGNDYYEVEYDVAGRGAVLEATVARCKNAAAVNFVEPYMRRRDPNAMLIADELPTDKKHYRDRFQSEFDPVRTETLGWLAQQKELIVLPFMSGDAKVGTPTLLIAPSNAGFFVAGLADLQGFIPADELQKGFEPAAIIYLAPPFRHTHFEGKQVVVHNRRDKMHELFSYNLYPGPSAKKGVYGILLNTGEQEGWVTLHASSVRLVTPYDNEFTILHEGASGGGKSEMTQAIHREEDGRILLAESILTADDHYIDLLDTCEIHPVTDDMALADPRLQNSDGRLVVEDAEEGWFLRVDHLKDYGTDPSLERLCINPPEPLIYLNIEGKPGSTALIWEHTMDAPGQRCPNPRVIMPRRFMPGIVNDPVEIDVRSFGVRTPPTTRDKPNYGIIGMLHILPPALAWLWRLVAPRGHSNPSIVGGEGLASEGVGSYWPFATGKKVRHANLLLEQIRSTPRTRYVLIPNQYIGAYHVGFNPEWIAREYIARRGSVRFRPGKLVDARCPLLGYALPSLKVNGQLMPKGLLMVHEQVEVGTDGYDAGAEILTAFFRQEISKFYTDDLSADGKRIIDVCLNNGSLEDYEQTFSG